MHHTSKVDFKTERLQSLKAGILGGFCLCLAFVVTSLFNSLVLAKYLPALSSLQIKWRDWHFLLSGGVAASCGLLFGVTYRYILRQDKNLQLKAGSVLAFGLVRGLTQLDTGVAFGSKILPLLVMGCESLWWFAIAAIIFDKALQQGWIQPLSKFYATN